MKKNYDHHSEEEIEKMRQDIQAQKRARLLENERCKRIKEQIETDKFNDFKPLWHVNRDDIDLSLQTEQLDSELIKDGLALVVSADVEMLLNSMQEGNPELFRKKELFHEEWSQYKTCKVLDHWLNSNKLIPPTIIWNRSLDQTYVADGKHRFNVAFWSGVDVIPIIVPNIHFDQIRSLVDF